MLDGQKLQGVLTASEVAAVLARRGWALQFPLFAAVHAVLEGAVPVQVRSLSSKVARL